MSAPKETKLYELLGVKPDADEETIKKAFRKKALQLHPDRESDPEKKKEKEKLFSEVSNAHEILTDSEMRARYDRYGMKGVEEGGGDRDDGIFPGFFGGGGGKRREPKPKDTMHQIDVPLEQFYSGAVRKLAIRRQRFCGACSGAGTKSGKSATCEVCNGQGARVVLRQLAPGLVHPTQVTCSDCRGNGSKIAEGDKCDACGGERVAEDRKVFDCHIMPGMKHGEAITFTGEGNQIPGVRLAGNVVILLNGSDHPRFQRKGAALITKATVSLVDALCGFRLTIEHLDGRILVVNPLEGGQVLQPRSMYVIQREGMPIKNTGGSERGELVIDLKIEFPTALTVADQERLRAVLGPQTAPVIPEKPSTDGGYDTTMSEVRTSLEVLAKEDQRDDDDDGHGGGPQIRLGGAPMGCSPQ